MAEDGNPDYIQLMRLLGEAKPILEPMFPDQKSRWVGESALAQEISDLLARHPEFYDDIGARLGDIFPKPKVRGTGA